MYAIFEVDAWRSTVFYATQNWNAALVGELPDHEKGEHGTHARNTDRKEYGELVAVLKTSLCRREMGADPRQCVIEIDQNYRKEEEDEHNLHNYAEDIDVEAQIRFVKHHQDGVHECRR
jgi:hypothetical protein